MKIQVLLSTCNKEKIEDVDLKNMNVKKDCVIVNQFAKKRSTDKKNSIELYSFPEKGLSKSRNRLIELATGDVGIITDDDIIFMKDYDKKLEEAYKKYPQADVITFCTKKGRDVLGFKSFKKHNLYTVMTIASFQISFRIQSIKDKNIKVDELFGLGAKYKAGEENIFLYDCKKKGLNVIHVPIIINKHPDEETTGEKWDFDLVKAKGAFSYRILKKFHFIFLLYFLIMKHIYYKDNMSVKKFISLYMKGLKEYRKS